MLNASRSLICYLRYAFKWPSWIVASFQMAMPLWHQEISLKKNSQTHTASGHFAFETFQRCSPGLFRVYLETFEPELRALLVWPAISFTCKITTNRPAQHAECLVETLTRQGRYEEPGELRLAGRRYPFHHFRHPQPARWLSSVSLSHLNEPVFEVISLRPVRLAYASTNFARYLP